MNVTLWNELNDQQAENVSGGDGAAVVSIMNPQKGGDPFFGSNYGQFLKSIGLSARESNDSGNLNPSNVADPALGAIISNVATS